MRNMSAVSMVVLLLIFVDCNAHTLSSISRSSVATRMRLRYQKAEREHSQAMSALMTNMSLESAVEVFQHKPSTSAKFQEFLKSRFAAVATHKQGARQSSSHLRASGSENEDENGRPTGYSGVDKAKNMLNEMIEEVQKKYDLELQKCCEYDDSQSSLIEEARQDISMFNAEAAEARKEVLEAQAHIQICEIKLPELQDALKKHNHACEDEIMNLHAQLKIVMADVEVMTTILGMTECDKSLFLVRCSDECTGQSEVSFKHNKLQDSLKRVQSETMRKLLQASMVVAFRQMPLPENETNLSVPMLGKMTVKRNGPCKSPFAMDKRTEKCSMSSNPNCPKMQEKFMYIQAGIVDKKDELISQISKLEADCKTVRENLESQISFFETSLKEQQTALAAGTKKQNNAEEQSRLKTKELHELQKDYDEMTETCHTNYATLESEECGLKKIRGELYKMKGQDNPAFFQDCVVGDWQPGECSKSCAGGVMMLERQIVTHPVGGSACPALNARKPCNEEKCPIDCKLNDWEGWSECTAKCGGGLMERARRVMVEPEHGGEQCGETAEAESCNLQSCDKNCELSDWTEWSVCSKQCDSGVADRMKAITAPLVGDGECPSMRDDLRMQERSCNDVPCIKEDPAELTLKCESRLDVVLIIDGSASLGERGWKAVKTATVELAKGLLEGEMNVQLSVILYSNKVEIANHFSNDTSSVIKKIEDLVWPNGETYTSEALNQAASELSLGREDAKSVVVVLTDGKPMSMRKTRIASKKLREQARLMWVPVTEFAPLDNMRKWASQPKKDNFLALRDFEDLQNPAYIDKIIANICPKVS